MDNSGSGTSIILARHDYLPFGEEIWAGVGLRTTTQKYAATDKVRQRFALMERDEGTGLDHTLFRKYDNFAGRWLTPDPYRGSARLRNPQSFNRYVYVENDPVNFIDPLGLCTFNINISGVSGQELTDLQNEMSRIFQSGGHSVVFNDPGRANGGSLNLQVTGIYEGAAASHIRSQGFSIADPRFPGVFPTGGNTGYVNSTNLSTVRPFGTNLASPGTVMGRVASHELIQHGFLGFPRESRGGDITDAVVSRQQVFSPTTNRFNMNPITSAMLAGLCPPAQPAPAAAPNVPDGGGGGGGGGGGDFGGGGGGGGGYPSWWYALWEFLAWVNSIQIARVTVTVIDDVDPPEDEAN